MNEKVFLAYLVLKNNPKKDASHFGDTLEGKEYFRQGQYLRELEQRYEVMNSEAYTLSKLASSHHDNNFYQKKYWQLEDRLQKLEQEIKPLLEMKKLKLA
jgi:hypothetical protein